MHGARSELNSVFGFEKVDRWSPIRTSAIRSRSRPMRFLGFSVHEKGAPRQEISKCSTVCSTFSRSAWSVVRSTSLDKGGTSKKIPSPHPHKVPTRSNKVSPRTLLRTFVYRLTVPSPIRCAGHRPRWKSGTAHHMNHELGCVSIPYSETVDVRWRLLSAWWLPNVQLTESPNCQLMHLVACVSDVLLR
jgi:hypothetical protein